MSANASTQHICYPVGGLLLGRWLSQCHAVTSEDARYLGAVGRTTSRGPDYLRRLTEVCGAHDRRAYDGELSGICAAKVIEPMNGTSRNAQRLAGTDLDRRVVNGPS